MSFMSVTNIHDLFSYTTDVTSNNFEKIKPLYDLKQPKITGAASSLVGDSVSLSTNLCMFTDPSGKLTVGSDASSSVSSTKLAYLNNMDKPITESIENIGTYLEKTQADSERLIVDMSEGVTGEVDAFETQKVSGVTSTLSSEIDGLFNINLDDLSDVQKGSANKFIENNRYDGGLTINGSLSTSNLFVTGDTFQIDTDVYKTNQVEIVSSDTTEPCLHINHTASDINSANILELKSVSNRNAVIISSAGKMGINKTPTYPLDVNGNINIEDGLNFKINNNDLSFQDLDNLPAKFTPSAHTHDISQVTGLQGALDAKQDIISSFVWDDSTKTLNISQSLNLGNTYKFKINDVDIFSASSVLQWDTSLSGSVSRNLVNVTPYNINIDNPNYPYSKGIFLNEGSITTYSGNIESAQNVESKDAVIDKSIIIGNDSNKWRIYTGHNLNHDLYFENTDNDGSSWTLRAKMLGSARYEQSVYTNFTGIHHCRAANSDIYDDKYTGYIVSASEQQFAGMNSTYSPTNIAKHFDTNSWDFLPVIALSSKACDKSVFGVIAKVEGNDKDERNEISGNFLFPIEKKEYDRRLHIAGSGEGGIWVCDYNGILQSGDFITTSPISGIGMKQDNDVVCNYTVGKITMDCDFEPNSIFTSNINTVSLSTSNIDLVSAQTSNIISIIETKEYDLKYLDSFGTIIEQGVYDDLISSNIPVYKMAFVGCSYNCS